MAEFSNKRMDLVLLHNYEKSPGKWATKRSVLSDIRSTATAEETVQVTEAFRSLSDLELPHSERVRYEFVL